MHKIADIIIVSIALTTHTTRPMFIQRIKVTGQLFFVRIVAGPAAQRRALHTLP